MQGWNAGVCSCRGNGKIRENKFTQREIQITETPQQLKAGDGISFEMKFTLDLEETDADRIELKLRCGKEKESCCIFDLKMVNCW